MRVLVPSTHSRLKQFMLRHKHNYYPSPQEHFLSSTCMKQAITPKVITLGVLRTARTPLYYAARFDLRHSKSLIVRSDRSNDIYVRRNASSWYRDDDLRASLFSLALRCRWDIFDAFTLQILLCGSIELLLPRALTCTLQVCVSERRRRTSIAGFQVDFVLADDEVESRRKGCNWFWKCVAVWT
jgi:hypothetical protein